MIFQATHVYIIKCSYIPDPHPKISICICPSWVRFFWINTEARRTRPGAQLSITPQELDCLKHNSFIDTGEFKTFPATDLKTAEPAGILKEFTLKRIVDMVNNHKYLTGNQIKIINKNFIK